MAWTSVDDVLNRWAGEAPPTNAVLVAYVIDDVELVVGSEFPDLADRFEDEDNLLDLVKLVVARVAMRVLNNPDAVQQESLDGATIAYKVNADSIWLTPRERGLLSSDGRVAQNAFTINPTPIVESVSDLTGAWVNGPLGSEPW